MAATKAKGKKAPRAPKAAPRARPKPEHVPRTRAKPAPKEADEGQRDFLVVFEEPDPYGLPADDALILDIESEVVKRGQVDVQQKLDLALTNTTSRLGTFGFILSCVGALLGAILLILFAVNYPAGWYNANGAVESNLFVKGTLFMAIVTTLILVAGTVLTHYGRRIHARGSLSDVRLVEREPVSSPRFE